MESPDGFPDASLRQRPAAVRSGWILWLHRRAASSAGPGRFGISHGDFPMKDRNFPWDVQKFVQKFPTNQRFWSSSSGFSDIPSQDCLYKCVICWKKTRSWFNWDLMTLSSDEVALWHDDHHNETMVGMTVTPTRTAVMMMVGIQRRTIQPDHSATGHLRRARWFHPLSSLQARMCVCAVFPLAPKAIHGQYLKYTYNHICIHVYMCMSIEVCKNI